jgi:LacI family transcriptional regulator
MVDSRDIARLANVSQSSVSRALRDDPQISLATRNRIRKIAEEHGYVPNALGRGLATGATGRVGIAVSDMQSPYYARFISLLHDELSDKGYEASITRVDPASPTIAPSFARSVDGLVVLVNRSTVAGARVALPTVWLNSDPGHDAPGDWCMADNVTTGRLVAAELVRLGHRRIGMIFPERNSPTAKDRERGFRAELKKHDLSVPRELVRHRASSYESGREAFTTLMSLADPPTAIFCFSDIIAIGALNAAHSMGVRVPEDVSLIGVGDVPMSEWDLFRITSVSYDVESIVRWAVALLTERMQTPSGADLPARRMEFAPHLELRSTHGPVPDRV